MQQTENAYTFFPRRTAPDGLVARCLDCILAESLQSRLRREAVRARSAVRTHANRPAKITAQRNGGTQAAYKTYGPSIQLIIRPYAPDYVDAAGLTS